MRKKFLNNQIPFSTAVEVNRDFKKGVINAEAITEDDKKMIKDNVIKGEVLGMVDFNIAVVESNFHRTEIKKYDKYFLITEQLNFFGEFKMQKTNYYKIIRK